MSLSAITSHVLDTSLGRPAPGISLELEKADEAGGWALLGTDTTDADGRAMRLLPESAHFEGGVYRLTFHVASYFDQTRRSTFYPLVQIIFEVLDTAQHYHVPLLINPYGYTTYRGS